MLSIYFTNLSLQQFVHLRLPHTSRMRSVCGLKFKHVGEWWWCRGFPRDQREIEYEIRLVQYSVLQEARSKRRRQEKACRQDDLRGECATSLHWGQQRCCNREYNYLCHRFYICAAKKNCRPKSIVPASLLFTRILDKNQERVILALFLARLVAAIDFTNSRRNTAGNFYH